MPTEPPYEEIIADLNHKSGKKFRVTKGARQHISARWKEGYTLADFKYVNSVKSAEWKGTSMATFLRPSTLYIPKHFDDYLNQAPDSTLSDAASKTLDSCRQAAQEMFDDQRPDAAEE